MTAAELDRYFVPIVNATDEQAVKHVTVRARPSRWPLLVFGFTIAMATFAVVAMALGD